MMRMGNGYGQKLPILPISSHKNKEIPSPGAVRLASCIHGCGRGLQPNALGAVIFCLSW
jgi:hypothetical protein